MKVRCGITVVDALQRAPDVLRLHLPKLAGWESDRWLRRWGSLIRRSWVDVLSMRHWHHAKPADNFGITQAGFDEYLLVLISFVGRHACRSTKGAHPPTHLVLHLMKNPGFEIPGTSQRSLLI